MVAEETEAAVSAEVLGAVPAPIPSVVGVVNPEEQGLQQALATALREQYPEGCSIYVGNLEGDDEMWPEQLMEHFKGCGEVKRVIIKIDRMSGERLGHAYIDFADDMMAEVAVALDGTEFNGRNIKVDKKRKFMGKGKDAENGKG
eukprot:CAMPEP_0197631396 /NCGR_PEP_ID=MMETSP1338-20131121/8567_1 /TAXON_ID=43686 ORGANISM="Pelagodinium beii, Strain RCC1491" /NCGR_SAMPLE_ID=MMETSP1338 /ASSEMBLY_ACC=CAM_ASM_000754 /LENGTH=144 /DNA_ID=CAMNT_0043202825 /DNA_START=35 /DNA_END=466 /DNA_ORIENTATION=+